MNELKSHLVLNTYLLQDTWIDIKCGEGWENKIHSNRIKQADFSALETNTSFAGYRIQT